MANTGSWPLRLPPGPNSEQRPFVHALNRGWFVDAPKDHELMGKALYAHCPARLWTYWLNLWTKPLIQIFGFLRKNIKLRGSKSLNYTQKRRKLLLTEYWSQPYLRRSIFSRYGLNPGSVILNRFLDDSDNQILPYWARWPWGPVTQACKAMLLESTQPYLFIKTHVCIGHYQLSPSNGLRQKHISKLWFLLPFPSFPQGRTSSFFLKSGFGTKRKEGRTQSFHVGHQRKMSPVSTWCLMLWRSQYIWTVSNKMPLIIHNAQYRPSVTYISLGRWTMDKNGSKIIRSPKAQHIMTTAFINVKKQQQNKQKQNKKPETPRISKHI